MDERVLACRSRFSFTRNWALLADPKKAAAFAKLVFDLIKLAG